MIVHTFHRRTSLHSQFSTSLHCWTIRHHASKTLHFYSLTLTVLPLCLKIYNLQGKVVSASAGGWSYLQRNIHRYDHTREAAPWFWKNGFAFAFTYCNREVQREQALAYLNALPGALDVWSMTVTVFWNMTQCSLIMCTEISEEYAASVVTIDDGGDKHCLSKSYTFLQGLLWCIISKLKVNFANSVPAPQVPIFNIAVATGCCSKLRGTLFGWPPSTECSYQVSWKLVRLLGRTQTLVLTHTFLMWNAYIFRFMTGKV
jgi:hypothetical protein